MRIEQYKEISHLEGIEFIKALLDLEDQRFDVSQFLKDSTFEDINADFGIFPTMATYPVYFAGEIRRPENKIIFMGINPGFGVESNRKEREFLQARGLFDGYCRLFGDYRFENRKVRYYSNIAGFLRRLYQIESKFDWDWFQNNLVALEFIPYHSVNASGLRINDIKKYREIYFEIILKLLKHLSPQRPVFINGFPTWRKFVTNSDGEVLPEFRDVFKFTNCETISVGTIGNKYNFIGLPFLSFPKGGKAPIVAEIKRECGQIPGALDWQPC